MLRATPEARRILWRQLFVFWPPCFGSGATVVGMMPGLFGGEVWIWSSDRRLFCLLVHLHPLTHLLLPIGSDLPLCHSYAPTCVGTGLR